MLDKEVGSGTAEGLWARTEGNPFFLRELTKLLTTEQRLEQPDTAPVPVAVRDVVLRRVARLPHTAAEVLSVAAVAGRHFDIEVVAEAASVELDAALEVLDTAVAAGVVVEDQRRLGWFRFTHTLVAEALYETTGRLRRARLHRRIGAAATRAWAGDTERAAEIARHWLLAAELDPTAAAHACTHAADGGPRRRRPRSPRTTPPRCGGRPWPPPTWPDSDGPGPPSAADRAGQLPVPGRKRPRRASLLRPGDRGNPCGTGGSAPTPSRLVAAAVAAISGPDWYPASYGDIEPGSSTSWSARCRR